MSNFEGVRILAAMHTARLAQAGPQASNHLLGPWQAIISHQGEAYDSVRAAQLQLGLDGEVDISVRRGTALAHEDDDGFLPGTYRSGDIAYELDGVYLNDLDDESTGAEARFAQAQAMACGLNAVGGS